MNFSGSMSSVSGSRASTTDRAYSPLPSRSHVFAICGSSTSSPSAFEMIFTYGRTGSDGCSAVTTGSSSVFSRTRFPTGSRPIKLTNRFKSVWSNAGLSFSPIAGRALPRVAGPCYSCLTAEGDDFPQHPIAGSRPLSMAMAAFGVSILLNAAPPCSFSARSFPRARADTTPGSGRLRPGHAPIAGDPAPDPGRAGMPGPSWKLS